MFKHTPPIRLLLLCCLVLAGSLFFVQSARAEPIYYGDTIADDQTIDNDAALNGDQVEINGTINGNVFAFGKDVTVNGTINGSLFVVGDKVTVGGTVSGSVFAIATNFSFISSARIDHTLYVLTVSLVTERDAIIGRDLKGISLGARLRGQVTRDTELVIGMLELARLAINAANGVTTGKPISLAPAPAGISPIAQVNDQPLEIRQAAAGPAGSRQVQIQAQEEGAADNTTNSDAATLDFLLKHLRSYISYLIVGGLCIWLIPQQLSSWADHLRRKPLRAAGSGTIAYFMGFIIAVLLVVLAIATTVGIFGLSLTSLALTWGGLSFSATGLAFWTFLLFVTFISKIIVTYLVGLLILQRFYPRAAAYRIWPLMLGLLLYVIICTIPYLGWAVGLIITFMGLGAVWMAYNSQKDNAAPAGAQP